MAADLADFSSDELRALAGSAELLSVFAYESVALGLASVEVPLWLDRLAELCNGELVRRSPVLAVSGARWAEASAVDRRRESSP